ncbi:glycosyltransferase family 2 protein [Rheinheimera texasensis]|uniref:glycosyltransferase family 2 protein n=1 Tax=Rheinheimera texasensis TaxID=306205 RepID=UPI0012FF0484|nr:glycosyltransferase [Rheinheimera texasensis]
MKKVCMVSICYNSYGYAKKLVESVQASLQGQTQVHVDFVLSDNSTKTEVADYFDQAASTEFFQFHYLKNNNVGYFPGFYRGLTEVPAVAAQLADYDYVIVSNVDLEVDTSFFSQLAQADFAQDVGVIAPCILSRYSGGDINPQKLERPARRKLWLLSLLFRSPLLFRWYAAAYDVKAKRNCQQPKPVAQSPYVYSPHGSFIIFTKAYVAAGASLNYPRFLFGEELFVAEEAALHQLKIQHYPKVIVHDNEHASTSAESRRFICAEQVKSYQYLLSKYF